MKLIKFSATWCGPCKMLEQRFKDYTRYEIEKYDVDEVDEEVLSKYNIRNVPTVLIMDDNDNELGRLSGLFDISELDAKLDELENG